MQSLEIQGLFKAFCKFKDFPRTSVTIQGLFRTSSQIPGLFKTVQTLDIKLKGFEIQSKTRWEIKNQDGAILRSLLKKRAVSCSSGKPKLINLVSFCKLWNQLLQCYFD